MDLRQEAEVICHGLMFAQKTAEEVYREFFAPDAKGKDSKYAGQLTVKDIEEVWSWTNPPWKKERPDAPA